MQCKRRKRLSNSSQIWLCSSRIRNGVSLEKLAQYYRGGVSRQRISQIEHCKLLTREIAADYLKALDSAATEIDWKIEIATANDKDWIDKAQKIRSEVKRGNEEALKIIA